jgi:UDP-N-acetylglucosamine--N-acetylmuramyl-(pentapeptide) pyrophosphoryl-undecaprenol N-acetylglucosamine transferase
VERIHGAHKLKLLIAGGGTGGHVFPALAVAREWLERDAGREVIFVGTERGMEKRLIPEAGLRLETIRAAGLKGLGAIRMARNLVQLGPGFVDSAAILRRHNFNVAFGVGGYAAGPMMLMANIEGLPSVIFEPNAEPGFTNRVLADMATRIAAGYAAVAERWGSRAVATGCPVRAEFFASPPSRPDLRSRNASVPPCRLLITGGSQGSHAINRAVIEALAPLAAVQATLPLAIAHQTGERDYDLVREAYLQRGFDADVAPFFSNMPQRFSDADIIVCRAGAITVAEMAAAGRAAIFIPFGAATDSHQLRNAQEMLRAGAARLIPEPELTGDRLAREILALVRDPAQIAELGARARLLARPHAARDIADLIDEVARA